jgi:DNA invertase Pin-like site-specific DNA recombinase
MLAATLDPTQGVQAIIVTDISRLSRDPAQAANYVSVFKDQGVYVVFIDQDTSEDPVERIVSHVFRLTALRKGPKTKPIEQVLLYGRVSTVEQAERDLSIPAQFESMRRYCEDHAYTIIEECFDLGGEP